MRVNKSKRDKCVEKKLQSKCNRRSIHQLEGMERVGEEGLS